MIVLTTINSFIPILKEPYFSIQCSQPHVNWVLITSFNCRSYHFKLTIFLDPETSKMNNLHWIIGCSNWLSKYEWWIWTSLWGKKTILYCMGNGPINVSVISMKLILPIIKTTVQKIAHYLESSMPSLNQYKI